MWLRPLWAAVSAAAKQKRLVAPTHEKLDVLDDLPDLFGRDVLQRDFWPVAVVDAVVPSLEDVLEMRAHVLDASSLRLVLIGSSELAVLRRGDSEHPAFCRTMRNEAFDHVLVRSLWPNGLRIRFVESDNAEHAILLEAVN